MTVTATDDGWSVAGGVGEGTDTLSNIEIVDDAASGKILLVGNGGYATIQAAFDAAAAGDTIRSPRATIRAPRPRRLSTV